MIFFNFRQHKNVNIANFVYCGKTPLSPLGDYCDAHAGSGVGQNHWETKICENAQSPPFMMGGGLS